MLKTDGVGLYLDEVAGHSLLTADDEVRLARVMEAGRHAAVRLETEKLPSRERFELRRKVHAAQANWRKVVALAAASGVPSPAFMSALAYFDSYRSKLLPANLLQAQRDYFGAHTYERVDRPRGRFYHLDWPHPARPQTRE